MMRAGFPTALGRLLRPLLVSMAIALSLAGPVCSLAWAAPAATPEGVSNAYIVGGWRALDTYMKHSRPDGPGVTPENSPWAAAFDGLAHANRHWLRVLPVLKDTGCAECGETLMMAVQDGMRVDPAAVLEETDHLRDLKIQASDICTHESFEGTPAEMCPVLAASRKAVERMEISPSSGARDLKDVCIADFRKAEHMMLCDTAQRTATTCDRCLFQSAPK